MLQRKDSQLSNNPKQWATKL